MYHFLNVRSVLVASAVRYSLGPDRGDRAGAALMRCDHVTMPLGYV